MYPSERTSVSTHCLLINLMIKLKKIVILDSDREQSRQLCELLAEQNYPCLAVDSIHMLGERLAQGDCIGAFIDIDTVSITNRDIRLMALKHPGTCFFCLSKHKFHPELRDAICYHVYACINRPVDPDELLYWIRSIYQDDETDTNSRP